MMRGVVAAGHELTAQAAESVLRDGGNAFDAALAAHFAACVTEPVLASLGGGGFMLARPAAGDPVVYDFFTHTPRRKRPPEGSDFRPILADFGTAQQEFHIGQGTIATPGLVKGVFQIHAELCSMPLRQIVAPAVQYARDGVPLNALQAYIFNIVRPIYTATREAQAIYGSPRSPGCLLGEGESILQLDLADTLEALAMEGGDLFYRGEIAQRIVQASRTGGGHIGLEDLEAYQVIRRLPLILEYRGARVTLNPPPSSGGILIAFAVGLLREASPAAWGFGRYPHLRLLAEVMALTNQARVDALAMGQGTGRLLDPDFLGLYRAQVLQRVQALRGTTHISVMDALGNVASMTVSNGEGCGSIVPGTGIMLNNMLGEEDLNPQGFHRWAPDRRMSSMMSPTLVERGDGALIATGSGGSNRIRTALLQVLVNLIDFDMDVEPAVVRPRIHLEQDRLSVEGGFQAGEVRALIRDYQDHQVWEGLNLFFGGAHTVVREASGFAGAGDPRRGGVARVV
jgi:gamma-glutamyltranspeptidase/glutathione hydrolase